MNDSHTATMENSCTPKTPSTAVAFVFRVSIAKCAGTERIPRWIKSIPSGTGHLDLEWRSAKVSADQVEKVCNQTSQAIYTFLKCNAPKAVKTYNMELVQMIYFRDVANVLPLAEPLLKLVSGTGIKFRIAIFASNEGKQG